VSSCDLKDHSAFIFGVKQSKKNSKEKKSNAYRVLVGKGEGKGMLSSARCRIEDSYQN
jgi:hypothetical protein